MGGLWTEVATNFADPHKKLVVMNPVVEEPKEEDEVGDL